MAIDNSQRLEVAISIAEKAASTALTLFKDNHALEIEVKGDQDWVSNADKSVETQIRTALAEAFPDDGIIGEEHGQVKGSSGLTWVIDPIDGTSNFVNAMPGWCVVLACVTETETQLGVVVDPIASETFTAQKGHGAFCNGKPMHISNAESIQQGSIAVGHSSRVENIITLNSLTKLMSGGGMFYRNGSGALMLCYVAAGRLLAYVEPHMFAWDCLAGLLFIQESGGKVMPYDHQTMLSSGANVLAAAPQLYSDVMALK